MIGAGGLGSVTALQAALQTTPSAPVAALGGLAGGEGAGGLSGGEGGQSSASISPVGQLFSSLQQLQTQNPTQFQQVASTIAGQLESAAQQQGSTPAGQFLTNLANDLTNAANGGNLAQIQPYPQGGQDQIYNSAGQATPATDPTAATSGPDLQQLFANLNSEVGQALHA